MTSTIDSMGESGRNMKPGKTRFFSKPLSSFGVHPFVVEDNMEVAKVRKKLAVFSKDFGDLFPESSHRPHHRLKEVLDKYKVFTAKKFDLESRYIQGEISDEDMIKQVGSLISEYMPIYEKRYKEVYP